MIRNFALRPLQLIKPSPMERAVVALSTDKTFKAGFRKELQWS